MIELVIKVLLCVFIKTVLCVPRQEEPSNPFYNEGYIILWYSPRFFSKNYISGGSSSYESPYKTICYFTNWGAHRSMEDGKLYPENIPAELCTHILYAFGVINGNNLAHTIPNDIQDYQGQKVL